MDEIPASSQACCDINLPWRDAPVCEIGKAMFCRGALREAAPTIVWCSCAFSATYTDGLHYFLRIRLPLRDSIDEEARGCWVLMQSRPNELGASAFSFRRPLIPTAASGEIVSTISMSQPFRFSAVRPRAICERLSDISPQTPNPSKAVIVWHARDSHLAW